MVKRDNKRMILLFMIPSVLFYILIFMYPVIRTTVMSLFAVEGISQPVEEWSFIGLGNYIKLFGTNMFLVSLKNLFRIYFYGGFFVLVLALIFAVILTNGIRGKKFIRSVIYLPNIISAVAMGTMWLNYVYNQDYGLFNSIIKFFGGQPIMWTGPHMLFWSMLIAYCFGMVGYHMLIFISGIERIGVDYFEAADIAGANVFQKFWYITLPLLKGVIRNNIVIWTMSVTKFFVWSQLFSPVNLSNSTVTPTNYMYEIVFGSSSSANTARDCGAGAAIGVLMGLMVIISLVATRLIIKNDDVEL